MAADEFGCGMNNDVCAVLDRTNEDEILGSRFLHLGTNGYEQKIRENFKKIGKDIE